MGVTGTDLDNALRDPKSFLYQLVMAAVDKKSFDLMTVLKLVQENYEQRQQADRQEEAAYVAASERAAEKTAREIFSDKPMDHQSFKVSERTDEYQSKTLADLSSTLESLMSEKQEIEENIKQCNKGLADISSNWNNREEEQARTYVTEVLMPQIQALMLRDPPVTLPGETPNDPPRPLPPPPPMEEFVKAAKRVSPVQLYSANPALLDKEPLPLLNFGDVMAELRLKARLLKLEKNFPKACLAFNNQVPDFKSPLHTKEHVSDFTQAKTLLCDLFKQEAARADKQEAIKAIKEVMESHKTPTPSPGK